ncbi:hypothetical protein EV360DRAFT_81313 [Lentinula raphanica]|nr:hypothetical protein EV360DRAFT_81313 [Lentinula raphanica]
MLMHDTTPPRPAFFNEGKGTPTKSNPSSLKSFSMKGKISVISGFLSQSSSRANARENAIRSTSPATAEVTFSEKPESQNDTVRIVPHEVKRLPNHPKSSGTDRTPLTIARRISTTFRRPSHPARVPVPPAHSKQLREAALRERGLLPPKDMSTQEREQDSQLAPIVSTPQAGYVDGLSEADRIKQAWEAKILPSDQVDPEVSPGPALEATQSVNPGNAGESSRKELTPPPSPKPTLSIRKRSSRARLTEATPPPTYELPPTPLAPESVPLPPSPVDDTSGMNLTGISHAEFPDPGHASTPLPIHVNADASPDLEASALAQSTSSTSLHLESPITASATQSTLYTAQAVPQSPNRTRPSVVITGCLDSDESASIATPSLDTSSQLTSESPSNHTAQKYRPDFLVKTWSNEPSVPVIVESPIEGPGLILPINDIPEEESDKMGSSSPSQMDLGIKNGKRQKISIVSGAGARKSSLGKTGGKIGRSTSLANFRHSVVSTLTRKPTKAHSLTSDSAKLPPSPTVPASLASQSSISARSTRSKGSHKEPSSPVRPPRQALSPTIHSRASIIVETNNIEDEETRRMTEMAFMN